ncbi:MAG: aldo/keto reductase [Planctomycetes bacterium]|nr:aldo/keto reductase [Planctomycetota bacterium]
MQYTEYGKTGKQVSAVGFGGMRFDMDKSYEENADLLHYARSLGVNYFDTAPGYFNGKSEEIFGVAIKEMTGDYYIATKGSPMVFDTAQKALDGIRISLDRLGMDKIDFYHIWCLRKLEHYEIAMRPGGLYEGVLKAKEEGLVEHIVCSTHMPGHEVRTILSKDEFEGVLLGMNIINFPYRWDGVLAAREKGCGVVAMNPLAGGAIPKYADKLGFLSAEGETPVEAALRFNICCPQINVSLVGFTNKEEIEMACRIAEDAKPMSEEELQGLRAHLSKNMDEICTACGYCLDSCPEGIPIPSLMMVYNHKALFKKNMEEIYDRLRHEYSWGVLVGRDGMAEKCIQCGKCEEACTQHLPIIERLQEMARWEAELKAMAEANKK